MNKTDDYRGNNGGGTSVGFGPEAGPPRAGLINIHLFRSPASIADTLAHELAHNPGLSHYSSANRNYYPVCNDFVNLMKTGRKDNKVFVFQWARAHRMLKLRAAQGAIY
jgi:hypothetical protein